MSCGIVAWMTGRPSSGKSTLATNVQRKLLAQGLPCVVLDSDELRDILHAHDYSAEGRALFYATTASLAALLARQGVIALVPATAHKREYRDRARRASPRFLEVYVSAPVEECIKRDDKGLYGRARTDPGLELPGMAVAYEPPLAPDVVAEGGLDGRAADAIVRLISAQTPDSV